MNLITRRPPEDSLGDAGALAPRSVVLAIFVFRVVSVQLDLFLHLRLAISLVSPRRPFCLEGGGKKKVPPKIKRSESGDEPQMPQEGEKCLKTTKERESGGCGATWRDDRRSNQHTFL